MLQQGRLRIAISGGGLSGAVLMHALVDKENLDVNIFESATIFKEAGAAVGVTQNARRALELIGPSALQCLTNAGAVPILSHRWIMARGPDAGKEIDRNDAIDQPITNIVHRADLLRELLMNVPPGRMHASKKLERVEQHDGDMGPLTLHFSDGTVHECDVLVGADGIRSHVRKYVLGEHDPAASPVPAGWWFVQALRPYDQGSAALGKEFVEVDSSTEFAFLGDGAWWMHNLLSDGSLVQCVVCAKCDAEEAKDNWRRSVSAEQIKALFKTFPPPINKAAEELVCEKPELTAFYLWEHQSAKTYYRGRVCLVGDAAHSTTPWQSSGVGMAIEDALVLSTLLGKATDLDQASAAPRIFDQVRRPRTQRIVESSYTTGLISTGTRDEFDEFDLWDLKQMKENLKSRWDFVYNLDLSQHRDEAVKMFEKEFV